MMFALVLSTAVTFSSCSKDDDDNNSGSNSGSSSSSLIGLWYPKTQYINQAYQFWNDFGYDGDPLIYSSLTAYRFKNSDTVEELILEPYDSKVSGSIYTFTFDKYTIYNKQTSIRTCSYAKSGNTIYITNGDILSLSNGKLHSNGGAVFDKVQ